MSEAELQRVLAFHAIGAFAGSETACACDRRWRANDDYRAHVAAAIYAEAARSEQRG